MRDTDPEKRRVEKRREVVATDADPGRVVRDAQAALLDRKVGARSRRIGEILHDDFRRGRTRQLLRAPDKCIDASPRNLRERTAVREGEASTLDAKKISAGCPPASVDSITEACPEMARRARTTGQLRCTRVRTASSAAVVFIMRAALK